MIVNLTKHAEDRIKERGIDVKDVEIVVQVGTPVSWRDGKKAKEYKGLRVVYSEADDIFVVVTAYKVDKNLEQIVKKIPQPNEWWKSSDEDVFVSQAYFLQDKGLSTDEIEDHLTAVYNAVCGEYGE
jgi:hypothetical protein